MYIVLVNSVTMLDSAVLHFNGKKKKKKKKKKKAKFEAASSDESFQDIFITNSMPKLAKGNNPKN